MANVLPIPPPGKKSKDGFLQSMGASLLAQALEPMVEPFVSTGEGASGKGASATFVDISLPGSRSRRLGTQEVVLFGYESEADQREAQVENLRYLFERRLDNVRSLAFLWAPPGMEQHLLPLPPQLNRLVLSGDCVRLLQAPQDAETHTLSFACFQTLCNDPECVREQWILFQDLLNRYRGVTAVRLVLPAACLSAFRSLDDPLPFFVGSATTLEILSTQPRERQFAPLFIDCTGAANLRLLNTFQCRVPVEQTSIAPPAGRLLLWIGPQHTSVQQIPEVPGVLELQQDPKQRHPRFRSAFNETQRFHRREPEQEAIPEFILRGGELHVVDWKDTDQWVALQAESQRLASLLFGGTDPPSGVVLQGAAAAASHLQGIPVFDASMFDAPVYLQ